MPIETWVLRLLSTNTISPGWTEMRYLVVEELAGRDSVPYEKLVLE